MRVFLYVDKDGIANAGQEVSVMDQTANEWIAANEAVEISTCGYTAQREVFLQELANRQQSSRKTAEPEKKVK